jgi:hypothetical protein
MLNTILKQEPNVDDQKFNLKKKKKKKKLFFYSPTIGVAPNQKRNKKKKMYLT